MSDISLSKAVRSNLLSLKSTADMMATTQNRLATGNKVNSALDNPSSWFTAKGLTNRASDLGALIDAMANGIQTLEAADNGLTAMTKTLESMQSTLRQARQDKTFQTASFAVNKNLTNGNLTFDGGAVGNIGRSIPLANEALTNVALGLDSDTTATSAPGAGLAEATAGVAAITFNNASDHTLAPEDTINLAVTVDNVVQNITITGAELANTGDSNNILSASEFRSLLAGKLTGVTVGGSGNSISIMSKTTGSTSNVSIAVPTITDANPASNSTLVVADLGLGAAIPGTVGQNHGSSGTTTFTWGGAPLEVNHNAKITLTAKVDNKEQKVEITREDVLKIGNKDGIINDATEFAAILSNKIEGASASASGDGITVTSDTFGTASTIELSAATVSGIAYSTDELVASINSNDNLKNYLRASNDNGKLRIENQSTQILNVTGASGGDLTGTVAAKSQIGGNAVRAGLAAQFNELRDQLDKLADDASFNGINLLRGDKLTITFNETGTSAIDIQTKNGETVNALNLGIPTQLEEKDLDLDVDIDGLLTGVKKALDEVRSQASTFGSNLSIVQNRKTFTTAMIDTLESGAGNLTLADMNTEAANLLALQTRQQLSQNSLSLASQADQSILQLLR